MTALTLAAFVLLVTSVAIIVWNKSRESKSDDQTKGRRRRD